MEPHIRLGPWTGAGRPPGFEGVPVHPTRRCPRRPAAQALWGCSGQGWGCGWQQAALRLCWGSVASVWPCPMPPTAHGAERRAWWEWGPKKGAQQPHRPVSRAGRTKPGLREPQGHPNQRAAWHLPISPTRGCLAGQPGTTWPQGGHQVTWCHQYSGSGSAQHHPPPFLPTWLHPSCRPGPSLSLPLSQLAGAYPKAGHAHATGDPSGTPLPVAGAGNAGHAVRWCRDCHLPPVASVPFPHLGPAAPRGRAHQVPGEWLQPGPGASWRAGPAAAAKLLPVSEPAGGVSAPSHLRPPRNSPWPECCPPPAPLPEGGGQRG